MSAAKGLKIVLAVVAAALAHVTWAADPIVIGISTTLSGSAAFQGQHDRWGAELAIEQINATGGVLGRPLKLDIQDNACNPAEGVNSVGKMLENKDLVAVSGAMCSSVTLALMPVMQRANVPFLVSSSSSPNITEGAGVGGNTWTFRAGPSDATMGVALARYLKSNSPFKKIAILGENNDYGRGGAAALTGALKPLGISVNSVEYYDKGAQDYTTVLTRLKLAKPDAIALYMVGADQVNFLRQYRGLGMHTPITGRPELDSLVEDHIKSGTLSGATSVFQYSSQVDTPANRAFVKAFKAKYKEDPLLQAAITYENVQILVAAIKRTGTVDHRAVREALVNTDYASMMGARIKFDQNNQAHNNVVILKVVDGAVKVVATPGS
jgi:branched-chain amino acid transport system substrate-binding protein